MITVGVLHWIFVVFAATSTPYGRYLLTVSGSIMYRYVLRQSESVPAVLMV